MTIADKDGKLLNTATIIANMKGNGSPVNDALCVVHDPTGEQLRFAYINSFESSIRSVSVDGIVSLNFTFKDKSSLVLKVSGEMKVKPAP